MLNQNCRLNITVVRLKSSYFPAGGIDIYREDYLGYIEAFHATSISPEFAILNKKELFAVKWFMNKEVDGKQFTAEVTYLIHPNGRIVFYYDKVSCTIECKCSFISSTSDYSTISCL
ncbi:unnamed protein product [Schistosoma guineensis]|nr:unnamed protein product [Schistosoma guineensis]